VKLIISAAAALALLAGAARAGDKAADKAATSNDTKAAAPSNSQITGDVKSIDAPAMTLIIVLPSGEQQQLSVASDASIKRDGSTSSLSQVKEGDNVRASYDPSTHQASQLDVKSKDKSTNK
jgi:Cu/Ag efflux protein CusF